MPSLRNMTTKKSVTHPFAGMAVSNTAHLRLLETTDLHLAIYPYDYYADRPEPTLGLACTGALIAAARAEAVNTILIDNGDLIQGTPMGDLIAYEDGLKGNDPHPMIAAMNTLDYAVSTLGNHEFNYGLDFLSRALAGANFPFVNANIVLGNRLGTDPLADTTLLPPYRIINTPLVDGAGRPRTIRIGYIGFAPPQIMVWDSTNLCDRVVVRDIVEAANAWVPHMQAAGTDLIVALSHSGIDGTRRHGMENAALFLAAIPGIDVVMAGHQHRVFPNSSDFAGIEGVDPERGTLLGKPAVMAGFWGSHLGIIDLLVGREKNGKWKILAHTSEARPIHTRHEGKGIATVADLASVTAPLKAAHAATLAYVRRPVGITARPLHSYFALVASDPSVQVVATAQGWYLEKMLKGTRWASLPLLSASAPFKAGGRSGPNYYTDVPAGPVALRNVADLYVFPNSVRALAVTGAQLREWLERAAGLFNQIEPGSTDAPLIDNSFPSHDFDMIDGVTYKIDVSQPARYDTKGHLANPEAHRILELSYAGRPVAGGDKFVIATNHYRAGGAGNFPGADGTTIIYEAPDTNRDVIARYIHEKGTINPKPSGNWALAPLPDTTVTFQTSPRAQAHLGEMVARNIAFLAHTDDGFATFRLTL